MAGGAEDADAVEAGGSSTAVDSMEGGVFAGLEGLARRLVWVWSGLGKDAALLYMGFGAGNTPMQWSCYKVRKHHHDFFLKFDSKSDSK